MEKSSLSEITGGHGRWQNSDLIQASMPPNFLNFISTESKQPIIIFALWRSFPGITRYDRSTVTICLPWRKKVPSSPSHKEPRQEGGGDYSSPKKQRAVINHNSEMFAINLRTEYFNRVHNCKTF